MSSLFHATQGHLFSEEDYLLSGSYIPLRKLIKLIYYLPMGIRKLLLDTCRIQSPILINDRLSRDLHQCIQKYGSHITYSSRKSHHPNRTISLQEIASLMSNFYDNPVLLCLISYFVRAETTIHVDEFLQAADEAMNKELKASQEPNVLQQLNYRCLFSASKSAGVHPEIGYPHDTVRRWEHHLATLQDQLPGAQEHTLLFPYYNGKKNIGYETQQRLFKATGGTDPLHQPTLRTTRY